MKLIQTWKPLFNTGDFTINNSNEIIMGPGLYIILSIKNQKVYFGESKNVPKRLGQHWEELIEKKHECKEMQSDWNFYGKENFKFISLSVGTQWDSVNTRQQKEIDLINLNVNYVYNQKQNKSRKESDLYKKVVSYKDTTYPSIAAASKATGSSATHIRRMLRNPNNQDWSYKFDQPIIQENLINIEKTYKVRVNNQIYRSIREASKQTNISRRTLKRHLDSSLPEHSYVSYVED